MVGKSELKLIKSLHQKKYRTQHKLFIAEGEKINKLLLNQGFKPYGIWGIDPGVFQEFKVEYEVVSEGELKKISALKNPGSVLGVYHIPRPVPVDYVDWIVALDTVSDPGNLGTVIRLCDWFGIRHLVCSRNTVDCFNPKVLQATMGSIARVVVHYLDLREFLELFPGPVYGAVMDGQTATEVNYPSSGILLMGNEAHGISRELAPFISKGITIKSKGSPAAESLNVAMATAILLQEVRRA